VTGKVCVEPTRASPWTVGAVLRDGVPRMALKASPHQWKVLRALIACRTGALGGCAYQCQDCRRYHVVAFGCGNRHCPQCQGRLAHQWLKQQQSRLLPVPYFHLVFTLPHALNPLIRQNRPALYELLFSAASQTLLEFGHNRFEAEIGLTMVLHTWGQRLDEHYHVHAIVTGGGWDQKGGWRQVDNTNYLFPIQALSIVFRGKFCEGLQNLRRAGTLEYHGEQAALQEEAGFQQLVRETTAKPWVVYAKKPFAGPETVLRYLSNYTHRVGMSSRRILHLDCNTHQVRFRYRDYARGAKVQSLQLDTGEFARRFSLHILPKGFCKVRHYGLLSNRGREQRLEKVRAAIGVTNPQRPVPESALTPVNSSAQRLARCPYCGSPLQRLVCMMRPPSRSQPGADTS
jgi:Putative transposase/Transposase zinc-binding domain